MHAGANCHDRNCYSAPEAGASDAKSLPCPHLEEAKFPSELVCERAEIVLKREGSEQPWLTAAQNRSFRVNTSIPFTTKTLDSIFVLLKLLLSVSFHGQPLRSNKACFDKVANRPPYIHMPREFTHGRLD